MRANLAETAVVNSDLVDKLLGRLPGEDRALLRMMYAEDMSIADIADSLGWTRSNVKIRAWRARASLKKLLKRYL
jgi:RNA polymerase sigma factor (sigma-70 family)